MLIHYDKPEVAIMRIRCPPSSITMMLPTEVTKIPVQDQAFNVKLAVVPTPSANADVPEPATVVTAAHTTNQTHTVNTITHTHTHTRHEPAAHSPTGLQLAAPALEANAHDKLKPLAPLLGM